mmetsp:Transcript_12173/g.35644  ORF Transcript_12173/g.35644 Transcript_12173/m.35644 type:complete len:222 (-) Transcript_12173:879-1544(-)
MQRVLAATDVAVLSSSNSSPLDARLSSLDLSFTHSSQSWCSPPHQGVSTRLFSSRFGTKSFHSVTCTRCESLAALAFSNISLWMASSLAGMVVPMSATAKSVFSLLYLTTTLAALFSISRGPTSIRIGTPFCSQWLYFHPGLYMARSSNLALTPAALRSDRIFSQYGPQSSSVNFLLTMGTMTAWRGATRGGRTSPVSSPWTMTMTPMVRVVNPQDVCHAI